MKATPIAILMTIITSSFVVASANAQVVSQQANFNSSQQADPIEMDSGRVWSHVGGNSKHQSRSNPIAHATSLGSPTWTNDGDGDTVFLPLAQTGLVVDDSHVYTIARDQSLPFSSFLIAYDRISGAFVWSTPLPPVVLDSWSTPTIDVKNNQILVASGNTLSAIGSSNGDLNWSTKISGVFVNASPTITTDLHSSDRVFITNYSFGAGTPAKLYCINIDPFDPNTNPFEPGEVVWEALTNGDSSGNTAAYANGIVYVATSSDGDALRGQIHAFDATHTLLSPPEPIWTFTNTIEAGFFGGVSLAQGHLYCSSYSFTGLQSSANTVKLDRRTGELIWTVATNRTDMTPVVLSNGDVIVSAGIATGVFDFLPFFGSLPSISYIQDNGSNADVLWDSALATLDDANTNGVWDFGEDFLSLGGWTHQPIAVDIAGKPSLIVGTLAKTEPGVQFGHNTDLHIVDLTKHPADSDFLIDSVNGTGSTPATLNGWIYTSGESGVQAFAPVEYVPLRSTVLSSYQQGIITFEQLKDRLIEQIKFEQMRNTEHR
jgi:PQQ-like domain